MLNPGYAQAPAPGGGSVLPRLLPPRCDPRIDVLLERRERHRACLEHRIVEIAQVEAGAERATRALAQFQDPELADLVGQGLARGGDVAVDLVDDVLLGL